MSQSSASPVFTYYNIGGNHVRAFSTTRHGGYSTGEYASFNINEYCGDDASHIASNRRALCDELGIKEQNLIIPHQTHGTGIRQITASFLRLPQNLQKTILEGVDAVMTHVKGVCVGVSTADCIPVLIYDMQHHACCAVHAGWRGTQARIVEKALNTMTLAYGTEPGKLECVIGPGISMDNFEVGDEVYSKFESAGFDMNSIAKRYTVPPKWHIDLKECNRMQLIGCGVKEENIDVSAVCTFADNDDYFSARRQGINSGRIYTGIVMR